jgi:LacI family transcriptional regulator
VIVASAIDDDPFVARLIQGSVPYVAIGRRQNQGDVSYVDVDNVGGAAMAVRHLARLGYRRIATITGPSNMVAGRDRYQGYLRGLQDASLVFDPQWVAEGQFTELSGGRAVQQLLSLEPMPDAIFTANDMMAVGALKAIRAAGLRVPDDIALVGYDDIPLAAMLEPALTTVRQSVATLGHMAATLLLDTLAEAQPGSAQRVVLPTELVVRASCGHKVRQRVPHLVS